MGLYKNRIVVKVGTSTLTNEMEKLLSHCTILLREKMLVRYLLESVKNEVFLSQIFCSPNIIWLKWNCCKEYRFVQL